jgi:hypothetical protein
MSFYVYIIKSIEDGIFYKGSSLDPAQRLWTTPTPLPIASMPLLLRFIIAMLQRPGRSRAATAYGFNHSACAAACQGLPNCQKTGAELQFNASKTSLTSAVKTHLPVILLAKR